ncbi:hypothetical protein HO542_05105 [Streptococcus suis]|nr:hypothetical protein [Streptococcus suis]
MENFIKDSFVKRQVLLDEMKEIDTKLVHLDKIVEAAHTVNKYKKVYYAYVKDKKNPIFKTDYSKEISDYKKALELLKNNYSKMPNTEILFKELEKLQEKRTPFWSVQLGIN